MYEARYFSNSLRNYMPQLIIVMSFIALLFVSTSSFARENNPGSALTCPGNGTKGFLSNGSYDSLVTSFTSNNYQNVTSQTTATGSTNANIPLKIKMSSVGSNTGGRFNTLASGGYSAIRFTGNTPTNSSVRDEITLEFQNSSNSNPLFLDKVALSAFDIDKLSSAGNYWDDNVKFIGTTQSGTTINGSFQNISNSNVINTNGEGLRLNTDANCGDTLESQCQGSIAFSDPVKSVKIIYTNTDNDTTNSVTSRLFDFRLDSYCYQPASYEITKNDGTDSIGVSNITDYLIRVTNNGNTPLTNIVLKDPSVTGLTKQDNITCDATDPTNTCTTAPSKVLLESTNGFTIPSLAVGKTYSIRVPTKVTAAQGSTVTNTASIKVAELAEKQASDSNTVTSIFSGGSPVAPAICPSGHKMYYIGANPPSYTPKETLPISWTSGSFAKEYVFGNLKFNLSFTDRLNLQAGYPTSNDFSNATSNAINMYHSSFRAAIDHRLTATINKPVSKYGFVVQDLDANQSGQYIESITLASPSGFFSRIENKPFQLSNGNQTISGTAWDNCNTASPCNFNIDWGYKPALTPFAITHGNPSVGSTTTSAGNYVTGYSDFYFCLAPPKLVVKKVLDGNRMNDTDTKRDQFEVKVTGNALSANSFTTTGNGSTVNNGTSDLLGLTADTETNKNTYTISERVVNGLASSYSATYSCNNSTTGSTFTTTNGILNADTPDTLNTRSFTISNLNYGDEITCTITNAPSVYTFTGFVFNDNGGIADNDNNQSDVSSKFTGNSNYFNGIFDNSGNNNDSGIGADGLQVRLTNCGPNGGTDIAGTTAKNIPLVVASGLLLGQYKFTVPASVISALTPQKVCLVQVEPPNWEYSVDTTPNIREVELVANILDYKTEANTSRNLDFGEVKSQYAALVLRKAQYVNDCPSTLTYTASDINKADNTDPKTGFSESPINGTNGNALTPGQCIAYRITATNRSNLAINDFVMQDILQKKGVNSAPVTSVIANPALSTEYAADSPIVGANGIVKTTPLVLAPRTKRDFYFNTKYGTTSNP